MQVGSRGELLRGGMEGSIKRTPDSERGLTGVGIARINSLPHGWKYRLAEEGYGRFATGCLLAPKGEQG